MDGKRFFQRIARKIRALVTEFHPAILGAKAHLAVIPYRVGGAPFASHALDLLRPNRQPRIPTAELLGDPFLRLQVVRRISDINFALAAKYAAACLQGSMHK
jgi:hypothetical protein